MHMTCSRSPGQHQLTTLSFLVSQKEASHLQNPTEGVNFGVQNASIPALHVRKQTSPDWFCTIYE